MSQLIGIIIAVLLGAIVTAFAYVYLGAAYAEQSTKAEAQKILNQAEQIEASLIAYKVDNGGVIKLGPSNEGTPGVDNEIFKYLVQDGYLKESINGAIEESEMFWHLSDPTPALPNSGDETIQRVVQDVDQCILANHLRNNTPKEGVTEGYAFNNGVVGASDVIDGVISCDSGLAANVSCCIK